MTDAHAPRLSPEARDRAIRTTQVAAVFADHADLIVAALTELPDGHVLVAVVDERHEFTGTHHVSTTTLVADVPQLEGDGGWAMVFPADTTGDDIARRTAELADINRQRIAVIDRINAKRRASDS